MGFRANGGFDFTKELKKILRKKKGFRANGGFGCTKEKKELRVEKYEKKRGGLEPLVDLVIQRKREN